MAVPLKPAPTDRRAKIAVLDDYLGIALSLADWSAVEARADVTVFDRHLGSTEEQVAALQDYDAICVIRERTPLPRAYIEGLPKLSLIAMTGRRNRTLDLQAAADNGVAVSATTGSGNGEYATVELAWGLILGLLRHIPQEANAMRTGHWQTRLGNTVLNRRLGLLGIGRLGARMVPIANAFGMEVVAWSPNLTEERAAAAGARYVDKATLFATSDVVSLHLVLGETTRGIVGAEDLGRMMPSAILVNTSRGPLVDQAALIETMRARRIAGAGLDVYDEEPLPADHPLRTLPNTLLTPHLGYTVEETLTGFYRETVENLVAWLDGAPIRLVHPD
ncbi:D-2-hydroxyacid dehydrogenase family protein [Acuticoccus mangrovi]|uniref:D-2-hydroxyacid dehydrogenase family protein n=1 Tax=Acuticoccus mangrovi TaxID=2796142 RepID=A0A934MDK2_9HYPH|nr:D-2-hydroxyacid dehydrogenase family protein [Acuticoccus mangrovi]MBJ3776457.1 D-2-hydroxyacid dehydrogenase family protein [Acuticoccus mangrovi]